MVHVNSALRDIEVTPRHADAHAEQVSATGTEALGHALRQPLHALSLLHALLKQKINDDETLALIDDLEASIAAINQTLSAFAAAESAEFPLNSAPTESTDTPYDPGNTLSFDVSATHIRPRTARRAARHAAAQVKSTTAINPIIFVVEDDEAILAAMRKFLEFQGHSVETYTSAEAFLAEFKPPQVGCLLVDGLMPGMDGVELLRHLRSKQCSLPAIVITGHGDISMAIRAMKAGAFDFLEKPAAHRSLLTAIDLALKEGLSSQDTASMRDNASAILATLTPREREVMDFVIKGTPNKEIAFALQISQRTVETHRAAVMKRTSSASLAELVRLVMRAQAYHPQH